MAKYRSVGRTEFGVEMHEVGLFVAGQEEPTIAAPVFGPLDDRRRDRISDALFAFFVEINDPKIRDKLLAGETVRLRSVVGEA